MAIWIGAAVLILWLVSGIIAWSWFVAAGLGFEVAEEPSPTEKGLTQAA